MLSLILPTFNEAANLPSLIEEITAALGNIPFEIIVVDDDSPDRTWEVAETLGPHVRVHRRIGRRGLSSAVVEGFQMAEGEVLAVMDSDGQHDPKLLPVLYRAVRDGCSVAIGSRYIVGGSVEGWIRARHHMSRVATALSWLVSHVRISDPMSGFFAIARGSLLSIQSRLRPRGFKILLEILAMLPKGSTVEEFPLVFRLRRAGVSKLSLRVQLQFLRQVVSLMVRRCTGTLLFAIVILTVATALLLRLFGIHLLYTDATLRSQVTVALNGLTEQTGWLLSDIAVQSVNRTSMTFIHREHHRGNDPERCIVLYFTQSVLAPCQ